MYAVHKTFQFEAAHRLVVPYQGKCNSVHGHSFQVMLTLEAPELDPCGMVEDFAALKPMGDWIQNHLDHATIVGAEDASLLEWLKIHGQKFFITPANPTSEVLARLIYDQAKLLGFSVHSVRVSETCTSAASFTKSV